MQSAASTGASFEFALNHMAAPKLDVAGFFALARRLGITKVEIRNDLDGVAIADGTPAATVRAAAAAEGLGILSINALQRFNDWNAARADEARALASYAAECGARALVLCPVNERAWRPGEAECRRKLRTSLEALAHILKDAGILGLVEPLGFEECSLRRKSEAVSAIDDVGAADAFLLVHDTFHHHLAGHLAGEDALFADRTGLVHVSGVVERGVPVSGLRDGHRVLVVPGDVLGNLRQIRALAEAGYRGPFSFEPFADSVHALPDIAAAVRGSIAFITGQTASAAA